MKKSGLIRLRTVLVASSAIFALTAASAAAQNTRFSIPEEPLADALKSVAQQSGENILFKPDSVAGIVAQPLKGEMDPVQAVNILTRDTNLTVVPDGSGGVIVRPPLAASRTQAAATDAAGPAPSEPETVVVSASRISIAGYAQPTPVNVVNGEQLAREAKVDIGDSIRELPMVQGGSPQAGSGSAGISGAPAGTSTVSLRGLGILRTLVLFDGQRVVQSNITGGVDLNTIPTSLIQRVDVVTGGASAAWGSDAVAGVINLVLNKNMQGFKATVEASDNYQNIYRTVKTEGTFGTSFDAGRGQLTVSASYVDSPDTVYQGQAKWNKSQYLVPNPAATATNGLPALIHVNNAGMSLATTGGLITASPASATAPANALRGIAFTGPSGTPAPFNIGNVAGSIAWGGDANFYNSEIPINEIAVPYTTLTLFGYGSYKITDDIVASAQLNFGREYAQNTGQTASNQGNLTIQNDNAYLPATIKSQMATYGITSFTMGTVNTNNVDLHHLSPSETAQSLGIPVNNNYRQLMRGVFTLQGALGNDWSWNSYIQYGESRIALRVINNTLTQNVKNASDAVTVTAANVGTSGLPLGSIACRTTLTAPGNGCKPLDVFGIDVASPDAIAYTNSYGNIDYENYTLAEEVASASMQGTLPWQLPAGPVAVAFGGEYRLESGVIVADPRGAAAQWGSGNFTNFKGEYNIQEGFVEVDAPLVKDSDLVQSVDFNAAGRLTNYSTSGLVQTWKVGLTSQVNDDLRLRTTWSTDIRAPDLSELFAGHQLNQGTATDPHTGITVTTYTDKGGNPNLLPEVAHTVSGGVVLTPHWVEGLVMSFDWYSIDIVKAIQTPNATQVLQQCAAGVTIYCSQLEFNGNAYPGALGIVHTVPINAASASTSGLDFNLDYDFDMLSGSMKLHLVGNYNDENTTVNLGVTCDAAGAYGTNALCTGLPKLAGVIGATYSEGPVSATLQGRFVGSSRLNNAWVSGRDVDNNSVPWNVYPDLRLSYNWGEHAQLFGDVDNFLNLPAQIIAPIYSGGSPYSTSGGTGDLLGRVFRMGIRFEY